MDAYLTSSPLPPPLFTSPQCAAFNAVCSVARSDSWFRDVADRPKSPWIDLRPDLVMYTKQPKIRQLYTLSNTSKKDAAHCGDEDTSNGVSRTQNISKCIWGHIQAFVECNNKEVDAAFYFADKSRFLRPTDNGELSQARIAKFATEIQVRQHRTHLWSFCFAGPYLRLQRWDRAGCMVSKAINFQEDPTELVNFLYRFARMTGEQLGYDVTAVLAIPKEIKMLANYKSDNFWLQNYQQSIMEAQEDFPIYKVRTDMIPRKVDCLTVTNGVLVSGRNPHLHRWSTPGRILGRVQREPPHSVKTLAGQLAADAGQVLPPRRTPRLPRLAYRTCDQGLHCAGYGDPQAGVRQGPVAAYRTGDAS